LGTFSIPARISDSCIPCFNRNPDNIILTLNNNFLTKQHSTEDLKWSHIDMSDSQIKDLSIVKVYAPAGYLLLWDSRTFHCNTVDAMYQGCAPICV